MRVFSLYDKACVATLGKHMSVPTSIAFSEDGYTMATGSRDQVVNIWEMRRYALLKTMPVYEEVEGLHIMTVDGTDDETSAPDGGEAPIRVGQKRKRRGDARGLLAVAGSKGAVRTWSYEPKDDENMARQVKKGGNDNLLVCTLLATEPVRAGVRAGYASLAFHAASRQLVAVTADHNFVFMDPATLTKSKQIVGYNDEIIQVKYIEGPHSAADGVEAEDALAAKEGGEGVNDGGARLAVATNSAQVRILSVDDLSCELLEGHQNIVLTLDVCASGRWLVTGSKDRTCRVWDLSTGECVMLCVGHTEAVAAVSFSRRLAALVAGGSFFVSGSGDRTMKRWNVDARTFSSGGGAGTAPRQPTAQCSARAHEKDINAICVAPNDAMVASASQDKTAKLWSASDLSLIGVLKGHKRGVWAIQFSPVDKCVATCSADRTIKIWSIDSFTCLKTFQGHSASVLAVDFLSNGLQLMSSGADGLVSSLVVLPHCACPNLHPCPRPLDALVSRSSFGRSARMSARRHSTRTLTRSGRLRCAGTDASS